MNIKAVSYLNKQNLFFANGAYSATIDDKKELRNRLISAKSALEKQLKIAKTGLRSEQVAVTTGTWESAWGLIEALSSGVGTTGILFSKVGYLMTSLEEAISGIYLSSSYSKYVKTLKERLSAVDSLLRKFESSQGELTKTEKDILQELEKPKEKERIDSIVAYKEGKNASKMLSYMQAFNGIVLTIMAVMSFTGRGMKTFGRLPRSMNEPVLKIAKFKENLFKKYLPFGEKYGSLAESLTISLPMALLAGVKFNLARNSLSQSFANLQFAQGLSHVACTLEGALNAYQVLFTDPSSKNFKFLEKLLTMSNAADYLGSSYKLLKSLTHIK